MFCFFEKEETLIICFLLTFYFDYQHLQLVGWFHLYHLWAILHIRWQDKICNKNVLGHKSLSGFEAMIFTTQMCRATHVSETEDAECQSSCWSEIKERPHSLGNMMASRTKGHLREQESTTSSSAKLESIIRNY